VAAQSLNPDRLRGLAPVAAPDARVLILGSFPSEASLAARQYYAHPRNHFWPLLEAVLDEPLTELPYRARLVRVKARGIAVWDSIIACERAGSLDAAIRNAQRGEITRIRKRSPGIQVVGFNGGTALRAAPAWRAAGYGTLALPSSSPAYTRPFAEKLAAWRAISAFLDPGSRGPSVKDPTR
jgi:double-stranded uracil-DNA glycosylase